MKDNQKVLTVGELSELLRVHRTTIYRLLRKGQISGFRIGSDWRFNVETLDKLSGEKLIEEEQQTQIMFEKCLQSQAR
jgi:excisionase family DNA binding protein